MIILIFSDLKEGLSWFTVILVVYSDLGQDLSWFTVILVIYSDFAEEAHTNTRKFDNVDLTLVLWPSSNCLLTMDTILLAGMPSTV